MTGRTSLWAASAALLALVGAAFHGSEAGDAPGSAPDPAALRKALLARLDAEADAAATRAHLAARLALDAEYPIPYLGVDADPTDVGMQVTRVYPHTSAEAAGLRVGDLLLQVGGAAVTSRSSLGRAIRTSTVGQPLVIVFQREGKIDSASVALGRRGEEDEDEEEQFPELSDAPKANGPGSFNFQDASPGPLPDRLESVLGGHGAAPRYAVLDENGARFLRQSDADPTGIRFPMAWVKDFVARDVIVRVRFRLVDGSADRAAGLVFRAKDAGNYLVARVNASEGDVRIFRTVSGLRRTLPGAVGKVSVDDSKWHTLEVRAEGPKVRASVDGGTALESYDTYFGSGRVGLWTKSDSVSDFDDLSIEPIASVPPPR